VHPTHLPHPLCAVGFYIVGVVCCCVRFVLFIKKIPTTQKGKRQGRPLCAPARVAPVLLRAIRAIPAFSGVCNPTNVPSCTSVYRRPPSQPKAQVDQSSCSADLHALMHNLLRVPQAVGVSGVGHGFGRVFDFEEHVQICTIHPYLCLICVVRCTQQGGKHSHECGCIGFVAPAASAPKTAETPNHSHQPVFPPCFVFCLLISG